MYAPTRGTERVQFLNILKDVLKNCKSDDFIFLGEDFNCTENDGLDINHMELHKASQQRLSDIIETHELVDVWRRIHHDKIQYSGGSLQGQCDCQQD